MKILLAGEGRTELGGWWVEAPYLPPHPEAVDPGVLEALLLRVAGKKTWTVASAQRWRSVRKFQAGNHRAPETRTVMGLALRAVESGCDAVVFSRDRDGDREREQDVERGIELARQTFSMAIIGSVAVEEIEAWVLALLGETRSEQRPSPKERLSQVHGCRELADCVARVSSADWTRIPEDAASLHRWLDRARALFGVEFER
jgi:hypothetical protein